MSSDAAETKEPAAVIVRAQETTQKVMELFPVRAFQRFSARNGQVLAAGISYQALFAIFAALYVAFAGVGLWLGGNTDAINGLINIINQYLPGAIGEQNGSGIISEDAVFEVASQSMTTLGVTGLVALGIVLFTAVGWIGSIRATVRDIFGLAAEKGNPVLMKLRDLAAAAGFAVLLLIGAALGWVSTSALNWLFAALGWTDATWLSVVGTLVTVLVMFLVNTVTLWMLFRFLTGTNLSTRDVLPGSLLGGAGMAVLQLAFGYLIGKTPSNPLLVTFAVLIGLLLWIRLVMTVILFAASWVAESAAERDVQLEALDEREQALRDATVLRDAARLSLAEAENEYVNAGFWKRARAHRAVIHAQNELAMRIDALNALSPKPGERAFISAHTDREVQNPRQDAPRAER